MYVMRSAIGSFVYGPTALAAHAAGPLRLLLIFSSPHFRVKHLKIRYTSKVLGLRADV